MLPLAHLGHYLWIFYVVPVLIVIAGILRSSLTAKGREQEKLSDKGRVSAEPGPRRDPVPDEDAPPAGGTGREAENGDPVPARRPPSR